MKKLIGYKVKEKYREDFEHTFSEPIDNECDFHINSALEGRFERLDVLDLWCDPVYEIEIPPKGTPVLDEGGGVFLSCGRISKHNHLIVTNHIDDLDGDENMCYEAESWTIYEIPKP